MPMYPEQAEARTETNHPDKNQSSGSLSREEALQLIISKGFLVSPEAAVLFPKSINEEKFSDFINKLSMMGRGISVTPSLIKRFFHDSDIRIEESAGINDENSGEGERIQQENKGYAIEGREGMVIKEEYLLEEENSDREVTKKRIPISLEIVKAHEDNDESGKIEVKDFVGHFNARFNAIQRILMNRNIPYLSSISQLRGSRGYETVSIIGIIYEIRQTKNNTLIFDVEDKTGRLRVIVTKRNNGNGSSDELWKKASMITPDEVVAFTGRINNSVMFPDSIIWPDIPIKEHFTGAEGEDLYAVFISDMHIGSINFLTEKFSTFIEWISGRMGNKKQREIARRTPYVFILGDLVDGVGIYPNQLAELKIADVREQYKETARLLSEIPKEKKLIIIAGNHDAVRLSEPQPRLLRKYASPLYELPNAVMLPNPSLVRIQSANGKGMKVLMYHGYSIDYYIAHIDALRAEGGYDRSDLVMKYFLQRRHLAPTHSSNLYMPYKDEDPLVISDVPDVFAIGHLHKTTVSSYKGITLICGSTWQSKTSFQEKVGHHPEPGRVPIINIRTGKASIMRF